MAPFEAGRGTGPSITSTPAAARAAPASSIGPAHRKQRSAEPGVGASAWGAAGNDAGWTLNRERPTCSQGDRDGATEEQVVVQPLGPEGPLVPVEGGLDVGDGDGDVIEPFDRHVIPFCPHPVRGLLVIGVGAGGSVATLRLAQAGARVVCLEQGPWVDRQSYPGTDPTWELQGGGRWSSSPTVRRLPADYPVDATDSDMVVGNFNGVGGGTVIFAGVWPRLLPERLRDPQHHQRSGRRLAARLRPARAVLRRDRPPVRRVGARREPGLPAGPRPAAATAARGEGPAPPRPRARAPRVALVAGDRRILSAPYDGRHTCVQRGTSGAGCSEGAKASTDLTHWPTHDSGRGVARHRRTR